MSYWFELFLQDSFEAKEMDAATIFRGLSIKKYAWHIREQLCQSSLWRMSRIIEHMHG